MQSHLSSSARTLAEIEEIQRLLEGKEPSFEPDRLVRTLEDQAQFSVASVYHHLCSSTAILSDSCTNIIWHKLLPPRVQVFAWKFAHQALPTKGNFARKIQIAAQDYNCELCKASLETQDHLFLFCPNVKQIWNLISQWWSIPFITPTEYHSLAPTIPVIDYIKGAQSPSAASLHCNHMGNLVLQKQSDLRQLPDGLFHFIQS